MPVVCYRPASSSLTVIAQYSPLPESRQADRKPFLHSIVGFRCVCLAPDRGVSANVAYAHHDNNRNVPDEWV